jgi:hypothetical protein
VYLLSGKRVTLDSKVATTPPTRWAPLLIEEGKKETSRHAVGTLLIEEEEKQTLLRGKEGMAAYPALEERKNSPRHGGVARAVRRGGLVPRGL